MGETKYLSSGTKIPGFGKILKINLHLPEKFAIVYVKIGNYAQRTDQKNFAISHSS